MIKSLRIQNCESHLDTKFDFSPGLNVFVGESDKGKSGVFRAYKLLTQNKPGGDWCRPLYWEGDTIITGEFINPGLTLTRTRSKSENTYTLNDEKPINAGTSVPENIAKLLDLDDVNLQTQIERAFLMFESSGERGRILNRIAGLEEIETTLDNAKQDVNRLNKSWLSEKGMVEAKEKELEVFVDIEEMERRVGLIETAQNKLDHSESRIIKLDKLADAFESVENAIVLKEGLLACEGMLEAVKLKTGEMTAVQSRVNKLKGLAKDYSYVEERLQKENFEGIEERFQKIRINQNLYAVGYARVKKLKKIVSDYSIIDKEIEQAEAEILQLQTKIPNVCFECGQELK